MQRILFVEDNAIMLQMYGMMLDGDSSDWQVALAANGEAALDLMSRQDFDVVVSDFHMPGMSGAELARHIRRLYPRTSRIIISGVSDQKEVADALGDTHQFIAKPFDLKTLQATLARIRSLDGYLNGEKLKMLIGRLGAMPSFPMLYLEIMQQVQSPDSSLENIAELIALDPSLTAKILQVVNSAAIGLPQKIHSPFEAVQQLGLGTVRSLALSAHVFSRFNKKSVRGFSAELLWEHLMKTAALARKILQIEQASAADLDDAYTAGMLHDMGKLMLADGLPDEFQKALALSGDKNIPLHQAEQEIFGATHAGIAAYLLGLWGLPAPVVEAVALHHTPDQSDLRVMSPLTAVHAANALLGELPSGAKSNTAALLNENHLALIGVIDRVECWRELARQFAAQD